MHRVGMGCSDACHVHEDLRLSDCDGRPFRRRLTVTPDSAKTYEFRWRVMSSRFDEFRGQSQPETHGTASDQISTMGNRLLSGVVTVS